MTQYLLLIYGEQAAAMNPDIMAEVMKGHEQFGQKNAAAIKGGEALEPTSAATCVVGSPGTELEFAL